MSSARSRTVLCPIDFTPLSERSLRLAVAMCRCSGARLVLEHNLESRPPSFLTVGWMWSEEHEASEATASSRAVEGLKRMFEQIPGDIDFEAKITHGPVDASILYLAKNLPADLIVMGTRGPSSARHDSLTERIILRAPCPVLATGEAYRQAAFFDQAENQRPENPSILVPVDFTARSRACVQESLEMSAHLPLRIHLVHCATPRAGLFGEPEGTLDVEDLATQLKEGVPQDLRGRFETRVVVGEPVRTLLDYAREIDALFIVVAAHGKSAFRRFLFGDTTLGVLHGSISPVWFVPPAVQRGRVWSAA